MALDCRVNPPGSVEPKGRICRHGCASGSELQISSEVPEANSDLENNPPRALRRFRPAGADERELPVPEFGKDAGRLSSTALGEVFEGLFSAGDPATSRVRTRSQSEETLLFARHVLAPSADRDTAAAAGDPVALIREVGPPHSADNQVLVPAIGTGIALAGHVRPPVDGDRRSERLRRFALRPSQRVKAGRCRNPAASARRRKESRRQRTRPCDAERHSKQHKR